MRQGSLFAIILPDHVQNIGKAVVVIIADIGAKQRLGYGTRRVVFMKDLDQAGEDRLCDIGFGRVVYLISGTVNNYARMISVATDHVTDIDL